MIIAQEVTLLITMMVKVILLTRYRYRRICRLVCRPMSRHISLRLLKPRRSQQWTRYRYRRTCRRTCRRMHQYTPTPTTVLTATRNSTATAPASIMEVAASFVTRRVSQTTLQRRQTGSIIALPTIPGLITTWARMGCFAMTRRLLGVTRVLASGLTAVNHTLTPSTTPPQLMSRHRCRQRSRLR